MRIFDTFGHAFADMKAPPDKETYFPTDNQPVVDDRILTFYYNGVSVLVNNSQNEIVCPFQASRFEGGCYEQYFAVLDWNGERSPSVVLQDAQARLIDRDDLFLPIESANHDYGVLSCPLSDRTDTNSFSSEHTEVDCQSIRQSLNSNEAGNGDPELVRATSTRGACEAMEWCSQYTGQLLITDSRENVDAIPADVDVVITTEDCT